MSATFSAFDTIQAGARCIAAGQAKKAREVLEPLVGAASGYAVAHVLFARACEETGDLDAAREAWRYVFQLVPTSPLVRRERDRVVRQIEKRESPETPLSDPSRKSGKEGWAILNEEEYVSHRVSPVDVETIPPNEDGEEQAPVKEFEDMPVEESLRVEEEEDSDKRSTESADALAGELDDLIARLGSASRITPDPDFEGPEVVELATEAPPSMASETLADVYAAQGQYEKAAETYERLAEQKPDRARDLKKRAAEMRSKA